LSGWQEECKRQLQKLISSDDVLLDINQIWESKEDGPQLHVAIFVEPYLTFILDGKKTVESRFSSVRCAPYNKVRAGDIILLKKAGGPVIGLCRAHAAWFYTVDRQTLKEIRHSFAEQICPADSGFWSDRENSSFATLISISDVQRLPAFMLRKRDRRGWVTIPR